MFGQNINVRFGGPITPAVKNLMIINGGIFLLQNLIGLFYPNMIEILFGLNHTGLVQEFKIWQIFTYMFLHGGWLHIIFNLLTLWMFAGELEQLWGSKNFTRYYIYTGIGAGIFIAIMNFFVYTSHPINFNELKYQPTTIGASGAIYAILLAYGMTWPNREVLIYFIIPIKIKYLVIIFGLIEFFGSLSNVSGSGSNISHIGHLGGLFSGFIYIYFKKNLSRASSYSKQKFKNENFVSQTIKAARLKKKKLEIDNRIKAKKIIDELLEKIAKSGMGSLTSEEKKNLEWARKHYYPGGDEILH